MARSIPIVFSALAVSAEIPDVVKAISVTGTRNEIFMAATWQRSRRKNSLMICGVES